ncbi:hypothetical protein ONR75_08340 [Rhodopseudomonas sp. P2A-2r]|nr:hypothetical protein ONR75_08340 [Rhodopseudomonas sp. P2A-2r]
MARVQLELRSALGCAMASGFVRSFLEEGKYITQLLPAQLDASQIQTGAPNGFIAGYCRALPSITIVERSDGCFAPAAVSHRSVQSDQTEKSDWIDLLAVSDVVGGAAEASTCLHVLSLELINLGTGACLK